MFLGIENKFRYLGLSGCFLSDKDLKSISENSCFHDITELNICYNVLHGRKDELGTVFNKLSNLKILEMECNHLRGELGKVVSVANVAKSGSLKGTPVKSNTSTLEFTFDGSVSSCSFAIALIIAVTAESYLQAYALLTDPKAIVLNPLRRNRLLFVSPHEDLLSNAKGNISLNLNCLDGHVFRIDNKILGLLSK